MPDHVNTVLHFDGLIPLATIVGLLVIGVALIYSGSDLRARMVAKRKRIDQMRWQSSSSGSKEGPKRAPERQATPHTSHQINDAEHRQIIRSFARLGIPAEAAISYFNRTRLILPVGLALSALPLALHLFARFPAALLLAIALPAAIGRFLPMLLVRRSIARRRKAISAGLPDALELLAVCIEAGLSLENALQRVASELKRSQPELADELAITWAEINMLPDRDKALVNLAERVNVPSVRSVVATLSQTLRYGTPLARSLRVIAADARGDQITLMEEKANRLPALMTVPVMLFIMPTIFLIIGGPAALKVIDIFFGKP